MKNDSFVPEETKLKELTFKSLLLGLLMAVILGAANAYLGLKAGMTVSATFPAAVIAMALLKVWKGTVLEENITRTTAAVGEALVAGAIFTLPAFFMSGAWVDLKGIHFWEATFIILIGGVIGVLFVILLRRPLIEESNLPFPESVACAEIVKAGQKGQKQAKYVFSSMGFASILELLKNESGFQIFKDTISRFFIFPQGKGGIFLSSPILSSALVGVGYIIGFEWAAVSFAGGILTWLVFVPIFYFTKGNINGNPEEISILIWKEEVRPIAVGAMLVGAFYTLYKMRGSLIEGFKRSYEDMRKHKSLKDTEGRLSKDLPLFWIISGVLIMVIPMFFLYTHFVKNFGWGFLSTIIMIITAFIFSAVGGYLVGLIGGSNQPISGLALTALIISSLIMLAAGLKGVPGIIAVLATAAVVCCASSMAGDMIQDLKVGQIIGGTPWKMELVVIISVIVVSFTLIIPIRWLHYGTPGGLGGENLPAPQAGLMAFMSKGIMSGEMPFTYILIGIGLGIAFILLKAPSPMLIAVGMYLPFSSTFAIFLGGIFQLITKKIASKKGYSGEEMVDVENKGTLIASGFVAGEAIIGVLLALIVVLNINVPKIYSFFGLKEASGILGLLVFILLGWILIKFPLSQFAKKEQKEL
jgi:putative OPT family oligopeptide transporter